MKLHLYYVYILTNSKHSVLYIGVTNDLQRRCFEHSKKIIKGFTSKYNVDKLIYYEKFDYIELAIVREKQLKGYSRIKKENLINNFNPQWKNLFVNGLVINP